MTESQARDALAGWRDGAFADLLTVAIGLAAQQRPEELRKALGSVFDLTHYENRAKVLKCQLNNLEATAHELRELIADLLKNMERLEAR